MLSHWFEIYVFLTGLLKEGSTRAEKDGDFYKPQGYNWYTPDLKDNN